MKTLAWMAQHVHPHAVVRAPEPTLGAGRLVVSEVGASSLDAALSREPWQETVLIAEQGDAARAELPARVASRIALLERHGNRLACAVLLVGSACDASSDAARELVARALLTHLIASGSGELIVSAHEPNRELRDRLVELVGKLLGELTSQAVTIRLQFRSADAPRRPSRAVGVPEVELAT